MTSFSVTYMEGSTGFDFEIVGYLRFTPPCISNNNMKKKKKTDGFMHRHMFDYNKKFSEE